MGSTKFEDCLARLMSASGARSDSELARILEIKPPSVAAARKRQQIPGAWVKKIAERFSVSADWLFFGTGEEKVGSREPGAARLCTCDTELVLVPMVQARLAAGTGSFETSDEVDGLYAFRSSFLSRRGNPARMVMMRVAGDSMEPKIEDGDVVLIDQSQAQPQPGQVYAVGIEDAVYIKVIDFLPGKLVLKSANPAYPPIEVDARQDLADGVRIIGHVIWVGRELK